MGKKSEEHVPVSPPNTPVLRALLADAARAEYTLDGDLYTIGRAPSCHIVVGRPLVSRLHAKIERVGSHFVLSDVGSANGTFVSRQQIHEPQLLQSGVEIGLGAPEPLFCFHDPEATEVPPRRLWFDERRHAFVVANMVLQLSPNLHALLAHLYQHEGQVCTRESCVRAIWRRPFDDDYAALLHREINDLRRAIEQVGGSAALIKNVRGVGYRLELG